MNDVAKFTQSIAFNLQVNTISFSSTVDDALTGDTTDCSAWCINEQSSSADSNAPDAFNVVTFARPPNDQISCGAMDRTCFCVLWNSTADEEGVVFSFLVENGGIVIFYFVLLVCSLVTTILTTQAVVELDKVDMATFAKAEGKLLSMQHAG